MTRSPFLLPILFQALSVFGQWSGGASDSGCTTLVETTSVGQKKDNYLLNFADGSSSSAAVGYHYRVTAQVTTPSSYAAYNDVYLLGATETCGGWFGGLYSGKMFIGTQCNSGSDAAIFDDTVLATSTAYQMEWNYNPKSGEYHVVLDGSLVMSGSASFATPNGYVSIGYGSHTVLSQEPWLGGLTSAKVEWCRVCESGCTAGNYESTACAYATARVCTACTAITQCASGLTCSSGSNEVCATCNSGFFGDDCAPCRTCSAGQYESTACTTTSNRVCADCRTCSAGQYASTACTVTSNRVCTACSTSGVTGCSNVTCTTSSDQVCAICNSGLINDRSRCVEASAVGLTGAQTLVTLNDGASGVYIADLDGDGRLDVLSSSYSEDKVYWSRNLNAGGQRDFAGTFSQPVTVTTSADGASSVCAADLDGDGDNDIISASYNDDKIAWYANTGGSFGTMTVISSAADGPMSVHAADLDGDNAIDVLSASVLDDTIAWYKNSGTGSFAAQTVITRDADAPRCVYAVDLNADDKIDVLTASFNDDTIAWYRNTGSGVFAAKAVLSDAANGARSAFAGDLNGDGRIDVISASYRDNTIAWYRNMGSNNFADPTVISSDCSGASSVFAADFDGDGDMDVVSVCYHHGTVLLHRNTGSGTFSDPKTINTLAYGENDGANTVFTSGRSPIRLL